mmetsp:Transcript_10115/g.26835  ORF Transcript_10115/g.26835 Transcript_10115/m.26835 type:complete len:102 (-) Transcript_10115:121-426(-)
MRGPAWARAGRTEPVAWNIDKVQETTFDVQDFIGNTFKEMGEACKNNKMHPDKVCDRVIAGKQALAILDAMSKLAWHSAEPYCGFEGDRPSYRLRVRSRSF